MCGVKIGFCIGPIVVCASTFADRTNLFYVERYSIALIFNTCQIFPYIGYINMFCWPLKDRVWTRLRRLGLHSENYSATHDLNLSLVS